MALTPEDRVQRGLDVLREGLVPFVERELEASLGDRWPEAVDERRRSEGRWEIKRDRDGRAAWDNSTLLGVMLDWWDDVFARALGPSRRGLVDKLRHVRNAWAHQEPFSAAEAQEALWPMKRMLEAVGAWSQARRVEWLALSGGQAGTGGAAEPTSAGQGAGGGAGAGRTSWRWGRPSVGLILSCLIVLCLFLAVFWQTAVGGSSSGGGSGDQGGSQGGGGSSSQQEEAQGPPAGSAPASGGGSPGPSTGGGTTTAFADTADLSPVLCSGTSYVTEKPSNLDSAEKDRVQAAVEKYLLTAYGDPSKDPTSYEGAVRGQVVADCFDKSKAAGYVLERENYARAGQGIGKGGAANRALSVAPFTFNKITTQPSAYTRYVLVYGTAVWAAEDRSGELVGRQEDLTLARRLDGNEWRVLTGAASGDADSDHQQAADKQIETARNQGY